MEAGQIFLIVIAIALVGCALFVARPNTFLAPHAVVILLVAAVALIVIALTANPQLAM